MRIVYVDEKMTGHHQSYLTGILMNQEYKSVLVLNSGEKVAFDDVTTCVCHRNKGFIGYLKWLAQLGNIAKLKNADIIHFLYGDAIYRFFGFGLWWLRRYGMIVITCHQVSNNRLKEISLKRMIKHCDCLVLHTEALFNRFIAFAPQKVVHIECPQFNEKKLVEKTLAKQQLSIDPQRKVLLALGGTRKDKGLDILIEALHHVRQPFQLLVAGKEEAFTHDFIIEETKGFSDKITCLLKFLSDNEFSMCLSAADVVVLPYRHSFDGASGPLAEGVRAGCEIIGPNNGSIGEIISKNHLGATFETENVLSLAKCIETALENEFVQDEIYKKYQDALKPDRFNAQYYNLYTQYYKQVEHNKRYKRGFKPDNSIVSR